MTNEQLMGAAMLLRPIAREAGSLHAYWDIIFDAEAHAQGKEALLSRDKVEREVLAVLSKEFCLK